MMKLLFFFLSLPIPSDDMKLNENIYMQKKTATNGNEMIKAIVKLKSNVMKKKKLLNILLLVIDYIVFQR